jgi:glutamate dehydrogenase
MNWETSLKNLIDRAVRTLRLERPSIPYEQGFSPEYRSLIAPRFAVRDVLRLEAVARSGREAVDLRPPVAGVDDRHCRVQVYGVRERGLAEIMPLIQNMGVTVIDQIQFKLEVDARHFFIRSFSVAPAADGGDSLLRLKRPILLALNALLSGQAEDDALNGLILLTGLDWRDIDLFRAYRNYYLQLGGRFGGLRFHQALLRNLDVTRLLHRYFEARFEPNEHWRDSLQREGEALTPIRSELIAALEEVADINDDRILRDLFNLIDSTLRTNFYRRRDQADHFIALKISSLGVINMPSPRPLAEIYVHSRTMEGVHLRGAKVARGGIRWSDRPDDLRSEILGLMQTQMVKNALIVPQGAKGGFVLKTACADAAERTRLARDAYATFMRGMLDLTDNMQGSVVEHPPQAVSYDDADPYLVVAADKGTGGWSDLANDIAAEYGYWLGDGFATGGSHGYHHKRLGITARGAWVCVRRHFHELGRDIDQQTFTVVGVGSMDGDVFGNGMLQSSNIRLLAAFSAEHIFLDPNPDRLASFAERKRLFETPGSSWRDYDRALISPGGGVFSRSAKDIPLSPEARGWLGARNPSIDGEGFVRLLLTAPVDLLWLGGVGTYVKAASETDEHVGDRANDGARVDAIELRAKVVGEGANLGFTQRARIEYALNGGRVNTDAVDNSGGVDLSDHEVNLKILMAAAPGERSSAADDGERNRLLLTLTDDVCRSVLANNYRQSLCLSLERERCREDAGPFMDLADALENAGLLDRCVESFPLRKEVMARAGQGLTRPELAVLMAYAKLALKRALLEAPGFLEGTWTRNFLAAYFPERVRSRYADRLKDHSLGREIAATMICNTIINQAGSGFLVWTHELDPGLLIEAAGLYLAFDQILEGDRWREAVRALDGKATASRQYELLSQLENALAFLCRWALEHGRRLLPDPDVVGQWRADLRQYLDHLGESAEFAVLSSASPDASRLLFLNRLRDFPVLVDLSRASHETIQAVARLFDDVVELLGLRHIATRLAEVKTRDIWERRLQTSLGDHFRSSAARLIRMQLRIGVREPTAFFHRLGMESRLAKFKRLRGELAEASPADMAPFAALGGELDSLIDACGAASGFD